MPHLYGGADILNKNPAEAPTTPNVREWYALGLPFINYMQNTDYPSFLNLNIPACGRLIRRAFTPHELPSLVEAIFLNEDEGDTIRSLLGDDAQAFIDVIDEACSVSARHPEAV